MKSFFRAAAAPVSTLATRTRAHRPLPEPSFASDLAVRKPFTAHVGLTTARASWLTLAPRPARRGRAAQVKRSAKKFQRVWVAFPESTNHPGGVAGPGYELARSTRPRKSHIRANTVKRSIAPFPRRPWRLGRLVTDHRERHPRPHRQTRACQQSANSPRWRRSCLQACERNAQAHPGQAQQPDFRRRGAHRPMPTALRSAVATLDALVAGCLTPLRFGNRFREPCRRQEALSAATAPLH